MGSWVRFVSVSVVKLDGLGSFEDRRDDVRSEEGQRNQLAHIAVGHAFGLRDFDERSGAPEVIWDTFDGSSASNLYREIREFLRQDVAD